MWFAFELVFISMRSWFLVVALGLLALSARRRRGILDVISAMEDGSGQGKDGKRRGSTYRAGQTEGQLLNGRCERRCTTLIGCR